MKDHDLHPPGERLADRRDEKNVGRAGKQETSVPAVPVHGELDRPQQVRGALDLVERDKLRKSSYETVRIKLSGAVEARLVKAEEGPFRLQLAGQSGLAALSRAGDADNWGVGQRLLNRRRERAGEQLGCAAICRLE